MSLRIGLISAIGTSVAVPLFVQNLLILVVCRNTLHFRSVDSHIIKILCFCCMVWNCTGAKIWSFYHNSIYS